MMAKEGNKTEVVIYIIRKKNMANFISHTAAELRERKQKKKSTICNIISDNSLWGGVALCCMSMRVLIDRFV